MIKVFQGRKTGCPLGITPVVRKPGGCHLKLLEDPNFTLMQDAWVREVKQKKTDEGEKEQKA